MSEYIEWFASKPDEKQRGRLFYDEHERLKRYEFHVLSGEEWIATIHVFYNYENNQLKRQEFFIRPLREDEWRQSREVEYIYSQEDMVSSVVVREVHERTGEIIENTHEYSYTPDGLVSEVRSGDERREFLYDDKGNIAEIKSFNNNQQWLVSNFGYDTSWNPFYNLPLHSGFVFIMMPARFSFQNVISLEIGQPGEEPASKGTGKFVVDKEGFPDRREFTFWNTSDPEVKSTVVTEYIYR